MAIELYPGKQLFVDDYRIESMTGAKRVLNQPCKHADNPILVEEKPWELGGIHIESILFDEERGLFCLWYIGVGNNVVGTRIKRPDNPPSNVYGTYICYAESDDAVHWERPALGIVDYEGSRDNNIVIRPMRSPDCSSWVQHVIDDPFEEDPARRFKMMYLDQAPAGQPGDGYPPDGKRRLFAHSPDGIHWTTLPWQKEHLARLFMILDFSDVEPHGPFDPDARYILYGQRGSPWRTRQIGRRDSNDFINWSENRPVLESSCRDVPGTEFYFMESSVISTTYAGLHLGMLGCYYTDLTDPFVPTRSNGLPETQLAYSRDSVRWERWAEPFIPRGNPGEYDWGGTYSRYPVIKDDQLYFLYTANSDRHGVHCISKVGLATMRLDGFVSVESQGYMRASVTTRPYHWQSEGLRINVNAAVDDGALKVQLQDETGKALEGFSSKDCDPIGEDAIDKQVTWKGKANLAALHDRMVAVKFLFSPGVKLYSYALTPMR